MYPFLFLDVKELSQRCVGGLELLQQRQKIQALSEETNSQLKKNVYQNYMQFIETAKEISRILFLRKYLRNLKSVMCGCVSTLLLSSSKGAFFVTSEHQYEQY